MTLYGAFLKGRLNALVLKRFYNPPTRKTWSKQHPDFRTRRPLVEPYNLGRLHPEKEWWRLPKKGLNPQTFMGFPDVEHITKRGGSLYTHLMDGHTLTMIVYRCLEKNVEDITIWKRLSMQALKLSMSLDPYIVSLLFLYFSRCMYYDYKFVATFTGRILATLDQFKLIECSNVLMAMENERFMHEMTRDRVILHAEALCLATANSIPPDEALRFLSSLSDITPEVKNILVALGEIIEMADLSTEEEHHIIDALYQSCEFKGHIDLISVNKMFDELCDRLDKDKECKHSRNIALLKTMAAFGYRRPLVIEIMMDRLKGNVHTCNVVELCRYMAYSSRIEYKFSTTAIRSEALKYYDQIVEDHELVIQYLQGCMRSSRPLESRELKLLVEITGKISDIPTEMLLDLHEALACKQTDIPDEFQEYLDRIVVYVWNELEDLSPSDTCRIMRGSMPKESLAGKEVVERAFHRVSKVFPQLSGDEKTKFIQFCANDIHLGKKLLTLLVENPELMPCCGDAALSLLDLIEKLGPDAGTQVFQEIVERFTSSSYRIQKSAVARLKNILKQRNAMDVRT